jgi:two-component system, sensor histidine kinase
MQRATNRSLRRKVLGIILFTTFVALLVSAIALLTYEAQAYREFLISDVTTQADIVARTSAPALAFNDPEAARETLALLANRPGIIAGAIYRLDGSLFATYRRQDQAGDFPPTARPRGSRIAGEDLTLFHPVIENNERLGTVYLQARYELTDRIRDYLLIVGGVMVISLLVAALVSLWLQGSLTGPILAVTNVAQKIVRDRDFMLRARRTSNDEIGTLVDAFNAMLEEVSERQQALEESNRKLQQETEERRNAETALRLADKRKDEFLATLAHELRNPLAPMVNALGLLNAGDTSSEDAREAREIIDRQLSHMIRLVEDLLDVSRISRGKLTVHKEPVELTSVLKSAVDTVRPLLIQKDQNLTTDLPDAPVHLQADPVRLSQVFSNLLNNATKYTEPGGAISLSAAVEGGTARVTIADSGKGMSSSTLPGIFAMFAQDDDAAMHGKAGLGVGLALAKRLVELHDGSIEAASQGLGKGSTFTVQLPVEVAPPAVSFHPSERAPAKDGCRHRILLVDDNVDFATSLSLLLRKLGHDVRVAHDAPEAIGAAREFRPEVAFLDIGLPTMDGYELARRLLDVLDYGVRLVAISGWGQQKDRRRAQEAGFSTYLVKPVDLSSVRATLSSLAPGREACQ